MSYFKYPFQKIPALNPSNPTSHVKGERMAKALLAMDGKLDLGRVFSWQMVTVPVLLLALVSQEGLGAERVIPNRTAPMVSTPLSFPQFSANPTASEIEKARVFEEPLVAMGMTSIEENGALALSLSSFLHRTVSDDVSALSEFLIQYPESPWKASLLCNLGLVYYRSGHFSLALNAWEKAWQISKSSESRKVRAIADRVAGELAKMNARLGRFERLEPLLQEIQGRDIRGSATEKVQGAKEGLWLMKNKPEIAFRCGPAALERILLFKNPLLGHNEAITNFPSTNMGVSFWEVLKLSKRAGLNLQVAKRTPGSRVLLPAVIHWKVGHYAALLERVGDFYHVQDPTFGDDLWITQAALEQEASGYFAVSAMNLPAGWVAVGETEARGIWGKGYASSSDGKSNTPGDAMAGGASGDGTNPGCGMPVYSFHLMLANLHIWDIPLGYSPPRGPAVNFRITYNHREAYQPALFTYANLGNRWTMDWLSYITDNPGVSMADVDLFVQGGGTESHTNFDSASSSFAPQKNSQAILVRTSSSPIKYERRLPNGSKELFEVSNGAGTYPRKVFLTKAFDPTGDSLTFTYDADLRLVSVTDAIGQVTTLSYGLTSDTLKVTQVTDPFGRTATLEYNGSGQLDKITDVVGLASEFEYGTGDFIKSLITPYGTTRFNSGDGQSVTRWVQATDPLGLSERVEFRLYTPSVTDTPLAPTDMLVLPNMLWHEASSIFWDKKAMAEDPNDYQSGVMYHWLRSTDIHASSNLYSSIKKPLESRVWYNYQNQTSSMQLSYNTLANPTKIGRVMDDSSTQLYKFEYNTIGNITKSTDPKNRITAYSYDSTGINLISIRQKTGTMNDLLDTMTYNSRYQPLTMRDASGQLTSFAYDSLGQLVTSTNPKGEMTTYAYDSLGYLLRITGHLPGDTTVFTYDGYGRMKTLTDRDGYRISKSYDSLDRVTKVTYPDSTYEQFVYNRLDLEKSRDRLGRWTKTVHNANRQPVAIQDPQGQVTNLDWCSCGQLQTLTDPRGKVTRWTRDLQGRVMTKVFEGGNTVQQTYEAEGGRLKTVTDAKGQTANYQYFQDGNLKRVSYTNAEHATPTVSYTYDSLYNRLSGMTDTAGTTSYAYNPVPSPASLGAGRLYKIDGPWANDTITFTYDSLGRVLTQAINGVVDSVAYDSLGRVDINVNALGQFDYRYHGASNRLDTLIYPNGQRTRFTYFGAAGDYRLSEIKNLGPSSEQISRFSYTFDAESQIKTWTQQADSSTARIHNLTYDRANQLLGDVVKSAASGNPVLKHYSYLYDKGGNRAGSQEDSLVNTYNVNSQNQLTSLEAGGKVRVSGSLNEAGTMTVNGQPADVSTGNAFDGMFSPAPGSDTLTLSATDYSSNARTVKYRVTSAGASQGFKYDDNGNMSGDRYEADGDSVAGTRIFQWDARDRLIAIVDGTNRTEFQYDGMDRRFQIVEKIGGTITSKKRLLWVGNSILEERDSTGGIVIKHFFTDGYRVGSMKFFYTKDHLGSIREVTDSLGAKVARFEYDPYGSRTQVSGAGEADFGFTGHYFHLPTGLHLAKYRVYNSTLGRWTSRDPIQEIGGINLYGYVLSNPLRFADPLGLAIGDFPPSPPGYNPCTWSTGQWDNGRWAVSNPNGRTYTAHPEDNGHWRHWDVQGPDGKDEGRYPRNSKKTWPNQKKPKSDQSKSDPNGNAPPWQPQANSDGSWPGITGLPAFPGDPVYSQSNVPSTAPQPVPRGLPGRSPVRILGPRLIFP